MVAQRRDKYCEIVSNKKLCGDYFELVVKSGSLKSLPGQFFMISVPGVFLRRPISVHDSKNGCTSFLYKVVGKGTKILSEMKNGTVKILGPLGKGYPLKCKKDSAPAIVAGGTGIASVHYLAATLKTKGALFYGARSKKDLLCLDKFKKLGWKIYVSTEDGSKGHKGFITEVLEKRLKNTDTLYVCGPTPMLKAVLRIALNKNIDGYLSLEEKMACGVGNCQGCAVKINGVYKMTCKDGPVFKIAEVEL